MEPQNPTVIVDYFVYKFAQFNIAPAANQTQQVNIQSDSDFEIQQIAYHATIAAAAFTYTTRPIPNVSGILTDTGSGRQLMNAAVPLPSFASGLCGENPAFLPTFKTFQRNSTIALQLFNFDAAVTYLIDVSLIGRKLFQVAG